MQWEPGGRWAVVRASPCAWCMVPATVPLRSLYTCVLEAPTGQEARKWLQLAVFCSPLAPGQTHLQLRVYFLNNTPCALQWAVTNEQPHGGRLRGPCQLFDFTGARGDQCLKLKYISEGEAGVSGAIRSPSKGEVRASPAAEIWEPQVSFWDSWSGSHFRGAFWLLAPRAPGFAHFLPLLLTASHPLGGQVMQVGGGRRGVATTGQRGRGRLLLFCWLEPGQRGGPVFAALVPLWVGFRN